MGNQKNMKTIIIGSGIAGLSLGFELTKNGAEVTILEAGKTPACETSAAAVAYMEPRTNKGNKESPARKIEWEALQLWPEFIRRIEKITNLDTHFKNDGQVRVTDENNLDQFQRDVTLREQQGWKPTKLDIKNLLENEPCLSPNLTAAIHIRQCYRVDARLFCAALIKAIQTQGGKIITGQHATKITETAAGVEVKTSNDTHHADNLAVCTGSITPPEGAIGVPKNITKVKGVGLILDMNRMTHPLTKFIKHADGILCPLSNGRLYIGATSDKNDILAKAEKIMPEAKHLPLLETRIGFRSLIGDGSIQTGCDSPHGRIFYSVGHGGSGFLRAPAIAKQLIGAIAPNPI